LASEDALADRRHFIVVLRLVTKSGGRLLYGEVVDVDAGPRTRFVGWKGMTGAVRRWLDGASNARVDEPVVDTDLRDQPAH
jgi:hypothetical protein